MRETANRLIGVSDNAASALLRALKRCKNPLAVHAVHAHGTHTPLLMIAKELLPACDRSLQPTCHAGDPSRGSKSDTWSRPRCDKSGLFSH